MCKLYIEIKVDIFIPHHSFLRSDHRAQNRKTTCFEGLVYSFSFHTLKQVKSVAVVDKESVVSLAVVASHAKVGDWR